MKSSSAYYSYSSLVFSVLSKVKVRVNCTLVQALRLCAGRTAHRGSRGIALLFLDHGTSRGEGSASHPGRSLPPGKTRYPLYRRMGGPQDRFGQVRKISPPLLFDPRTIRVTPRPLFTPWKDPVPIVQEAGWAPRTRLDRCGKSRPHRDSIPGPSSP